MILTYTHRIRRREINIKWGEVHTYQEHMHARLSRLLCEMCARKKTEENK